MKHILTFLMGILFLSSQAQVKVMSYNIRYDNENDGKFAWSVRKDAVVKKICGDSCDVVCMQEVLKGQMDFLEANLPQYGYVGVGRDDGKNEGEFVPIFYNKQKFEVYQSGTKWLSETPDSVSKGWSAACNRIVTWAVLNELGTKNKIIVVNTHFDHVSELARVNSADMINKLAFELQTDNNRAPVVLCGDFNAKMGDKAIKKLLQFFSNSRPAKTEQVNYSYVGFEGDESVRSLIDFIFLRSCKAKNYVVDIDNSGFGQLSDHLSISCTLLNE